VQAVHANLGRDAMLEGEIVILDAEGWHPFQRNSSCSSAIVLDQA
jgi:ATP-dependent DNA ligase